MRRIGFLMALLAMVASGCATTTLDYRTGVRVTDSSRLYHALERVAEGRQLKAHAEAEGLVIESANGDRLTYKADEEVSLTVIASESRQDEARQLGADLLVRAQKIARR